MKQWVLGVGTFTEMGACSGQYGTCHYEVSSFLTQLKALTLFYSTFCQLLLYYHYQNCILSIFLPTLTFLWKSPYHQTPCLQFG